MSYLVLSTDALLHTELCATKTVSILGTRLLVYAPTYGTNVVDMTIMWMALYVVISYMVLGGGGWIDPSTINPE